MSGPYGFTTNVSSGGGKQQVAPDDQAGPIDYTVRTADPDVYMGGANIDNGLPANGFLMKANQEYKFTVLQGSVFVWTNSTTTRVVTVFSTPHI